MDSLDVVIDEVESVLPPSGCWLLRRDPKLGYFANLYIEPDPDSDCMTYAPTAIRALRGALAKFKGQD